MSESPIKAFLRIGFDNDDKHPDGLLHGAIEDADGFKERWIDFLSISERSDELDEQFAKYGDPHPVVPGKRWLKAFPSTDLSNQLDEENVEHDGIVGAEISIGVSSAERSAKGVGYKGWVTWDGLHGADTQRCDLRNECLRAEVLL